MNTIKQSHRDRLSLLINDLKGSTVAEGQKMQHLINQIDQITRSEDGLHLIYEKVEQLVDLGIFTGSPWDNPSGLTPTLVKGTLFAGFPTNVLEVVSELRMLKVAIGEYVTEQIGQQEAREFLEDTLVASFDVALGNIPEQLRLQASNGDIKRIGDLFDLIFQHIPLQNLKIRIADEIDSLISQRPILTHKLEDIIHLVRDRVKLNPLSRRDKQLSQYVEALYFPSAKSKKAENPEEYRKMMEKADSRTLEAESEQVGKKLRDLGLVSPYQHALIKVLADRKPELIPTVLLLNDFGKAEFAKHQDFVVELILGFLPAENKHAIYGLKKLLERTLLSRKPVRHALEKLTKVEIHPKVEERLKHRTANKEVDPLALLVSGTFSVLGLPLGVGQGNNPTCQSARGISMWSQHAPAKLLNLIIDGASTDKVTFRYEGELVKSTHSLVSETQFDYELDPVSVVLVPLLDNIYGIMMQKAMAKHIGKDPHISVNPAFYGHWIQTGFISCYDVLLNAIKDYDHFTKIFYASFHPDYNGGHYLVYPVPLGIFITDAEGRMLGFHAISLLQVRKNGNDELRVYFYNPNNEGRQNWGQEIMPTVTGNNEVPGESSLPFAQFASRVYAFHYNTNGIKDRIEDVPEAEVKKVRVLASESWGRKYIWIN